MTSRLPVKSLPVQMMEVVFFLTFKEVDLILYHCTILRAINLKLS